MPAKVCILTTVHQPFDTRIFHKESKTLVQAGYNVTLIAQHSKNEIVDGVRIIALPKPKNRFFRIFFLTWKAYKSALKQKADIYHFHDPELLPWMVKLKRKTGAKVIYDVHEDYPNDILSKLWIPRFFRVIIANYFNQYEKKQAKGLSFVIAAWPKIKEKFKRVGVNNVKIITNYPILEYFDQMVNKMGIDTDKREVKLIYVGGLTAIRGIKEIVKSLGFIKNKKTKLILVGKFQEERLKEELKTMPEWQKVTFKGWLSQKEAYKEMQSANIGLICFLPVPNHIYSVPNKIFEYMVAGIPVVASDLYLLRKVVEINNCGICVNPQDPKEIAKAIEYLIEHPEEAEKMGENGRKAVLNKYNWEEESKKLLEMYKNLLK